ncbi:alpha/beta fold hydrolase [Mycobacterium sp. SMC-8]|uniref:alpha/beta fold hydrolase n=1 Tax=Mycobacterium sp. SMC-8 TaxID=2857060 RepID=UPI0037C8020F
MTVDNSRVHLRAWGDRRNPPLVLLHGGGAHSGWWDHMAPYFAATHYVIAPDLSGHGDSDRRPTYTLALWAREALAVANDADPSARPTLVGHSMGGWVAATAATLFGNSLNGIVIVDSPLREDSPEERLLRSLKPVGRPYGSREEIVGRFRLVPSQQVVLPYIASHIAGESVRRDIDGWRWKFDSTIFTGGALTVAPTDESTLEHIMERMACRMAYLRCEHGSVPADMADRIRAFLELRGPFVEIAHAGHHPMLDQPMALVATVRTLLEFWSIT